jgi:DNA-binding transcriptional LysR family regulator
MLGTTWTYRRRKSEMTVPVRSRLSVNTAEAAIDAAIAGLGITRVLSYQIAAARRAGAIEIVLEKFEQTPWPVSLVYDGQGLLPLKLRAILDIAAPRLRESILQSAV